MKLNAIIRIIIWSVILVILLGVLCTFTFGSPVVSKLMRTESVPEETAIPVRIEEDDSTAVSATVTATAVNVRSKPSSDSQILGCVELHQTVVIESGEKVNGQEWILISSPVTGWMQAEYVDTVEDVVFYSADGFGTGSNAGTRTAAVSQETGIYSAPNKDTEPLTLIPAGEQVTFIRQEAVSGIDWVYITEPQAGWVQAQYLSASQEDTTAVGRLQQVLYAPGDISELEIDWAAGTIRVQGADVEDIQISESEVSDIKYAMYLKKKGSKLSVEFCEADDLWDFGISINETISKDLTILVPYSWECDSLDIDAAAADLEVTGLVIDEVDIDSASGKCTFENCVVDELDVDTASGDILFRGELNVLECDAASALVDLFPENVPSRISVESLSGNLGLTLPASAGFTLDMDSMSGDCITDFGYRENKDGTYTSGDGACSIRFNSMSGMVVINKADPAADAVPEAPTVP